METLHLAIFIALVLAMIAGIHLYWGFGGRWPGQDEASFVERMIGRTKGMRAPGFAACAMVAVALSGVAMLVLWRGGAISLPASVVPPAHFAFWSAAIVFAARGLAAYAPGVFDYAKGTPFMLLNRVLYAPFCLLLAGGFALIGAEVFTPKI